MNTQKDIQGVVKQSALALVGLSRNPRSFSAAVYKELKAKGYQVFPVNPEAKEIGGEPCYPSLNALPPTVKGAVFMTPPAVTRGALEEAVAHGIPHLWVQQGAESQAVVDYCESHHLEAVTGQCILMFAEPVGGFHRVHRWFKQVFGGLPKDE